jgi:cell wall-associated NlpC family hydrolase
MTKTYPHFSRHDRWDIIPTAFAILSSFVILGCSGSSPRFVSGNNGTSGNAPRFTFDQTPAELQVEKSEAQAEDDRRVSTEKMKTEVNRIERAPAPRSAETARDKMMEIILSYMGTPYKIGGTDHSGMDCSGFSMVVFDSAFNIELPHSALEQSSIGDKVSRDDLEIGNLVFFKTVQNRISHVGIYLGDDLFAHASVTQGVTISSLESTYYKLRYAGAQKVLSTASDHAQ